MVGYKVKSTDTHVYFVSGPLSQWHESYFTITRDSTEYRYNCAEQYMMAQKALCFGDQEMHDKIMQVKPERGEPFWKVPKQQKELGRQVRNFDPKIWNKDVACKVVFDANVAKFTQNADLKKYLLDTENKILVEGSSYDRIYGVGLAWNDPKILDEKNWLGTNWLGYTLMDVRTFIASKNTKK